MLYGHHPTRWPQTGPLRRTPTSGCRRNMECGSMRWQLTADTGGCVLLFTDVVHFEGPRSDTDIIHSVLGGRHRYLDMLRDLPAGRSSTTRSPNPTTVLPMKDPGLDATYQCKASSSQDCRPARIRTGNNHLFRHLSVHGREYDSAISDQATSIPRIRRPPWFRAPVTTPRKRKHF